jgi:hypothetical protein
MQTNQLTFNKFRDFGDLLGDTFAFIKQEFKFFMKVVLFYAGPFVFIAAIASAWFSSGIFSMMGMMMKNNPMEILAEFGIKLLVYAVAAVISNAVLVCVVYSYIGLYIEKGKDGFAQEEVWYRVGRKFFPVLWAIILMGIIISVGTLFCFIPGIYFGVSLCFVLAIIFFENLTVGGAFSRSMSIVKDDWWFALGLGIVMYLMILITSYIFVLPSSIFSMVVSINNLKGNGSDATNITYMVLVAFGTIGTSLLSCVPHITLSLFYHSLIEKRESPGLLNKIEKINNPESNLEDKPRF